MLNSILIAIAITVGTAVTLSGLGFNTDEIKSRILEKFGVGSSATILVDNQPATSSATFSRDPVDVTLAKYNLNRFKNKKWAGNITQNITGNIGDIRVSMNSIIEIDELSLDFKNLDWAKQAKEIGITNTNIDGIAISISGKGRIKYQNPWLMFVGPSTSLNINSNPLPITFVGYIDPKNKILFFNEAFTNKPIWSGTETSCFPKPIGCISPITKSNELKAPELWLRGMTYEWGSNNELVLKEPIWNLTQKTYLETSLAAATRSQANIKMAASGSLIINN